MKYFLEVVNKLKPETIKDEEFKTTLIKLAEIEDEEFIKELLEYKIEQAQKESKEDFIFYDFLYACLPSRRHTKEWIVKKVI